MTSYTSQADLDEDGTVDLDDARLLAEHWLADEDDPEYVADYDLSGDGLISNADSDIIAAAFQTSGQSTVYYFHFDGLGSVIALTDADGNIVETYQYSAYGDVKIRTTDGIERTTSRYDNPYLFTARRYDPETGLYYFRARMYNPHIGRFLQTDTIGYNDGINWYTYCKNNPIMLIDSSGTCSYSKPKPNTGLLFDVGNDSYDLQHLAMWGMGAAWYTGMGSSNTYHGQDSIFAGGLKYNRFVNQARQEWVNKNYNPANTSGTNNLSSMKYTPDTPFSFRYGDIRDYYDGRTSEIDKFVGTVSVTISAIPDNPSMQKVTVENVTSFASFARTLNIKGGHWSKYPLGRGFSGTKRLMPMPNTPFTVVPKLLHTYFGVPMGDMKQTVEWEEPMFYSGNGFKGQFSDDYYY